MCVIKKKRGTIDFVLLLWCKIIFLMHNEFYFLTKFDKNIENNIEMLYTKNDICSRRVRLMKFKSTTVALIAAMILAFSGLIGYFVMNHSSETSNMDTTNVQGMETSESESEIYVHVKGEVKNPGLYEFSYGDRINDAIEKAGGATDNANVEKLNLAKLLTDEMEIIVPSIGDNSADDGSGKVNINTADSDELCTINGIGKAPAAKIIKYREENGNFESLEEIMNIDGIGTKTFESMKDYISIY